MSSLRHLSAAFMLPILIGWPMIASAAVTPRSTGLQEAASGGGLSGTCAGLECVATVVGKGINILLGFVGVVLLIMFIYAGFLWMTAGGEKDNVDKARKMIVNAVAGALIVASAYAISNFVFDRLAQIMGGGGEATEEAPFEEPASGTGALGARCTDSSQCVEGATCRDGYCAGGGEPASRNVPLGGRCTDSSQCVEGATCRDGYCAGGGGG